MTKEIESRIGEIIGEASMCWSEAPTGVFESTHANKLVAELTTLVEDVRKGERDKWVKAVGEKIDKTTRELIRSAFEEGVAVTKEQYGEAIKALNL